MGPSAFPLLNNSNGIWFAFCCKLKELTMHNITKNIVYAVSFVFFCAVSACSDPDSTSSDDGYSYDCHLDEANSFYTYTLPDGGVESGAVEFCRYFINFNSSQKPMENPYIYLYFDWNNGQREGVQSIFIAFDEVIDDEDTAPVREWPWEPEESEFFTNQGIVEGSNQVFVLVEHKYNDQESVVGSIDTGATADFSILQWPPDDKYGTGNIVMRISPLLSFSDGSTLELEFSAELETVGSGGWPSGHMVPEIPN